MIEVSVRSCVLKRDGGACLNYRMFPRGCGLLDRRWKLGTVWYVVDAVRARQYECSGRWASMLTAKTVSLVRGRPIGFAILRELRRRLQYPPWLSGLQVCGSIVQRERVVLRDRRRRNRTGASGRKLVWHVGVGVCCRSGVSIEGGLADGGWGQ